MISSSLFSGIQGRHGGILLHPTCLPSRQGIGTLGAPAREFVDFIAECGLGWWQVCPLGPTSFGDSPYQSLSSFAGNPYLIDFDALVGAGLLQEKDLAPLRALSPEKVEYGFLWEQFFPVIDKAWSAAKIKPAALKQFGDLAAFRKNNASWLEDYALFTALKKSFAGKPWYEWPAAMRTHATAVKTKLPEDVAGDVEAVVFQQFLFFTQWQSVREYAAKRGVKIIGDAPIFVALDSADVWANPQFFRLGKNGLPTHVAGVPPDYFSPTGQLWGNPLYDWDALKKDKFRWWIRRIEANLKFYDALRIDHFRAFHDYWEIPAGSADAKKGKWQPGPGIDFFKAVRAALGDVMLIAEDLGDLSAGVHALREATGLPGMAVLQFAFGGDAGNPYLPHNQTRDCVVYPGTHDNDTTQGWYFSASENVRDHVRTYFGTSGTSPEWDLLRSAFTSPAAMAIIPFQDILGLGAEARFNSPGTLAGNWQWRFRPEDLARARAFFMPNVRRLAEISGRAGA